MRALILGHKERADIELLIARAASHVIRYDDMKRAAEAYAAGQRGVAPSSVNVAQTMPLPVGFSVTYTHEEHRRDVVCRHISISVDHPDKAPHPAVVDEILKAFGFHHRVGQVPMWAEPLVNGGVAINAVEPLDGDLARLSKREPGTSPA
jgi:hypothetical protein